MLSHTKFQSKYSISTNKQGQLGQGTYGDVVEAVNNLTGTTVAIKKVKSAYSTPRNATRIYREVSILRMLKGHPKIVTLEEIITVGNELHLVFERLETNLHVIISSNNALTSKHIQYLLYQTLFGIWFVHSAKLVHRDLKPSNILVNCNDCSIKICDFGLARVIQDIREPTSSNAPSPPMLLRQLTEYVVTRWYRSPELHFKNPNAGAAASDMWSIGCILAELFLRNPIFPGDRRQTVLELIFDLIGTPPDDNCEWIKNKGAPGAHDYLKTFQIKQRQDFQNRFPNADANALDLLEKLLEFNPSKRITAELALQHPFFDSLNEKYTLIPFSIESKSAMDKHSFTDYMQFEMELDHNPCNKYSSETLETVTNLIKKEETRYAPARSRATVVPQFQKNSSVFFINDAKYSQKNESVAPTVNNTNTQLNDAVIQTW